MALLFAHFLCPSAGSLLDGCACSPCLSAESYKCGDACVHPCIPVPPCDAWVCLFANLPCPRTATWQPGRGYSHTCNVPGPLHDSLGLCVHMCTMSQHPHAMAWAHLFPRVLFPVPVHGSRCMPVGTPALCQCCHMQPGHTYPYTCHIQRCHFVMGTSTHTVVCLVPPSGSPWVYLFTCLPCSSTATWWHQHACSYPHSVPELALGLVCMPAVSQSNHMEHRHACMQT